MAILNITMPEGSSICNGKQVTFRAPCSSNGVTGIQISGVTYNLVDTGDKAISASSFVEGTMVSVIIDTENNKAYIQSGGGGAEIPVTTGVPEDADIWIDPSVDSISSDYYLELINGKASAVTYTATVTTAWTANGSHFYQDIAVPGILNTDNPIVDIDAGSDNAANVVYSECICKVIHITTSINSIRVWATEAIATAFPIQLKVVR